MSQAMPLFRLLLLYNFNNSICMGERYANVAILAVQQCVQQIGTSPVDAWQHQTNIKFGPGTENQKKGCPKSTFLTLCQEGLINGIPPGIYTGARENRLHTLRAIGLLNEDPARSNDPMALWNLVLQGENKKYNHQMHVITALWNGGFITQ